MHRSLSRVCCRLVHVGAEAQGDRQFVLLSPLGASVVELARRDLEAKLRRPLPEGFIKVQLLQAPREGAQASGI